METDPSIVDITASLCLLFFYGIAIPFHVIVQPFIQLIFMDDTKVT